MWGRGEQPASYPRLEGDAETSVLVVGGGITGLATAMMLREQGADVMVLEMDRVGLGTTGHSTGHLDVTTDTGMHAVAKHFGNEAAAQIVAANARGLDRAERWTIQHDIECDLRRVPGYMYAESADTATELGVEARAYLDARADCAQPSRVPLPFETKASVRFSRQIRFDPLDFTRGMARALTDLGGKVFEHTKVHKMEDGRHGVRVETSTGHIEAEHLVLATHGPLIGLATMQSRAHPLQSYVIAVRIRDEIEDALYWDQMEPYHYTRVLHSDDPQLLIIGGADHRTGDASDPEDSFKQLIEYALERYEVESVVDRWSHEYFEPADKLPYVGKLPGRQSMYMGTGFSGDGLAWGLVTAELISHLIEGREHPLRKVITPSRVKPLAAAKEMMSAGLTIARHAVGDQLSFSDVESVEDIPAGEGRLVRQGLTRLAVYKDEGGLVHAMSPVCRHAGCIVQWNNAAKTWDCPCHGGRYDAYGKVIAAPPQHDLERRELE